MAWGNNCKTPCWEKYHTSQGVFLYSQLVFLINNILNLFFIIFIKEYCNISFYQITGALQTMLSNYNGLK
jgi:hypothetical protein